MNKKNNNDDIVCVIYIWFGTFVVIQMSLNRLIHWHFIYSTRTAYQCHEIFYSRFFWVETFYLGPPYEQAKTVLQTVYLSQKYSITKFKLRRNTILALGNPQF